MKDNYIIPILIAGSILIPMFMFYFTVFIIVSKNRQRKNEIEKKEIEHQYEKQLLQTMLEVQEKASNQISQELHDNIGQILTGVHANLITLHSGYISDTKSLVEDTKNQVSKSLKDLRNLSHVLNSKYINKIGLEESLLKETEYLGSYNNIHFKLSVEENENKSLAPEIELMVFRIAQEALANIVKHAFAKNVSISIEYLQKSFVMTILDDGQGFDNTNGKSEGIGLINMHQRAEVMHGTLNIKSEKNSGTQITLNIPYE
ncbi:MAG: hypothetical protein H6550_01085 [Chitinophagales bacterium]|nr:hypothetical protein [Chitinophagales bacterium]